MESHLGLILEQSWKILYGSFDGSNDFQLGGLLIAYSLGYTGGKVIGSDEGVKLG